MTPERWAKIGDLLDRALRLPASERSQFLNQACAEDSHLRQEVQSFLSASGQAPTDFLRSPTARVEITAGSRLGEYEIHSLLGSGGMGEVYRARDSRLRRDVAIKILPPFAAYNPERLRRFEQEALASAALNHPNVLAVYQFGQHQGSPYLVSELLEGETLRARMNRGPIPIANAIDYSVQITRGLAAAHEKGIVHRDLKPENVFLTRDGRIKILDFGLAKLAQPRHGSDASAVTVGSATQPGLVMGTVGYMAPEQVRGETADDRADIFAFGAILYEMLTGTRAFQKPTPAETMTAILNEEPRPVSELAAQTPPGLRRLLDRCLQKNPAQRFQSASDLLFALESPSDSGMLVPISARTGGRRIRRFVVPAIALSIVAIAAAAFFFMHRTPKLTEKDTIVLADFDNKTGDPVFDDTLRQGIAVQLEQSPFLSLVSEERIQHALQLMGKPSDARLTPEIAREVCERTGGTAFLDGSIAALGSEYVLGLRARSCRTGSILAEEQVQAIKKEEVLNALGHIAARIRSRVGESLTTVEKYDTPLDEATTSSLEALKAFSAGHKVIAKSGSAAAIPFYKHAIELDPNFTSAYASLGRVYGDIGESVLSAANTSKAYQLQDHASDAERFFISASYDTQVTGNLEKAEQTCKLWAEAYPRALSPHGFLAGIIYTPLGKYDQAAEQAKATIALEPDFFVGYVILANSELALGRTDEAENTLQQAVERNIEAPDFALQRFEIAFLKGNNEGMARQVTLAQGKPGLEDQMAEAQALVLAYSGQSAAASNMSRQAMEFALKVDHRETAASFEVQESLRDALFRIMGSAKQRAIAALALSNSRDVQYAAAFSLALAGEYSRSQTLTDDLSRRFPESSLVTVTYLPTLRAVLALEHGEAARAIGLLQTAAPYEGGIGTLYPAYVRGMAFLSANEGREAAEEFQKILNHRGIVLSDPVGVLARLQIARAYSHSGDTVKAKSAYQDFLTLWKDADPDIPILKQAKAEYAKLQ